MRILLSFCTVAVLLGTSVTHAVTLVPVPFTTLVSESEVVVYGRVADVEGRWTEDRRSIESLVRLEIVDRLKGPVTSGITFKLPGGRAGQMINVIPGVPTPRVGDLLLVFLDGSGAVIPAPVGLTQGVLRVGTDARSGALLVTAPLGYAADGASAAGAPARTVGLQELSARVRAQVAAAR